MYKYIWGGGKAEESVGIGIDELRSVGLHCQSIMQAELNRLLMRRTGTLIGGGCGHYSTKSVSICLPLHKVPDKISCLREKRGMERCIFGQWGSKAQSAVIYRVLYILYNFTPTRQQQ